MELWPERWVLQAEEKVDEKIGKKVRMNRIEGSGELSGENPMELSDEHPMLEMTNDEGLMSKRNRRSGGQVV